MSEYYEKFCELLRQLHDCMGYEEDPRGDQIRDEMDFYWHKMSKEEIEQVEKLSADLYKEAEKMFEQNKSRFGYHCCDYETFLKLKELHKWFYEELHRWSTWRRWANKEPQNRVVRRKIKDLNGYVIGKETIGKAPEPKYCPYFHKNGKPGTEKRILVSYKYDRETKKTIMTWKPNIHEDQIISAYQIARMPKPTPKDVDPIAPSILKHLLELHSKVKEWYEQ